jgi:outer membrane protein assembly factor BamB
MGPFGPHPARSMGPPGPCRQDPAWLTLGLLLRHLGVIEKGNPVSVIAIVLVLIVACLGTGIVLSVPYRFIKRRQREAGKYLTRACAAAAAGIALAAVGVTAASASGAAPRALQAVWVTGAGTSLAATSPGAQLWVARYDNPGNGGAKSVAVSPNGTAVFVTGESLTTAGGEDYATVAYNAATGAQLWAARYDGPSNNGAAAKVTVSPDGTAVFVTGTSLSATAGEDYATVAYSAATGAQLWVARYNGVAGGNYAHSVAVSQDGKTLFVTGSSIGTNDGYDYATVAYNAATGAQLWASRYNGATTGERGANSVAVSGSTVFVTGSSYGGSTANYDYATVAYSAATGAQLWVKRYDGPGSGDDQAYSVAVSPSGGTVFVTGYTDTSSTSAGYDYTTIAYNATTGAQLWLARYNGPGNFTDEAYSVAVSPSGGTVYVTGESAGTGDGWDYATVAYNAVTGAQLWAERYDGAGLGSKAFSVAVSPTTGTVFVTGASVVGGAVGFYATVAYNG